MPAQTALKLLFATILVAMLGVTTWASVQQPVWEWGGLTTPPNHAWTIATLFDAYFGFITFYAWVVYKERAASARLGWFVAIMLTGNMAMSIYMLRELSRLRADEPASALLLRRPA